MNGQPLCPNGHPNRPGVRFCAVCGQMLSPSSQRGGAPPAADPEKRGPDYYPPRQPGQYGAGQQPGGQPTDPSPTPPAAPVFPPSASRKDDPWPGARTNYRQWFIWGSAGLILIILILALALFFLNRGDEEEEIAATEPAAVVIDDEPTPTEEVVSPVETSEPEPELPPTPEITPPVEEPEPEAEPQPAPQANLLINGDFREPWHQGWQRDHGDELPFNPITQNAAEGERVFVRLSQSGPYYLEIHQMVAVTPGPLLFEGQIKLADAVAGNVDQAGRALFMLVYYGEDQTAPLAWSIWHTGSQDLPWGRGSLPPEIGPNVALSLVADNDWSPIEIDIRQEVINRFLTIENPDDIRHIKVVLTSIGGSACGMQECTSEIQAAELRLWQE